MKMKIIYITALVFFLSNHARCQITDDVDFYDLSEDEVSDVDAADINKIIEDPAQPGLNPNLKMCHGVGLDCEHCSGCYPGGWCIKYPGVKPKCLCMYGWTGPNAEWVPDTDDPAWGKNRIRADNCLNACHYTHHVRNQNCIVPKPTKPPGCHPKCSTSQGKCYLTTRGKSYGHHCKCCRGWSGPRANYDHTLKTYLALYCDRECPFLGEGVPNPTCKKINNDVPPCDPKCERSEGKCLNNGRCLCCLGWTGTNAEIIETGHNKGKIMADVCDVYCPYTLTYQKKLCVAPGYVERRRDAGHTFHVKK